MIALVLFASDAHAQDDAPGWIRSGGVEGYDWGSDAQPVTATPRPRDYTLPDDSYIGANKQDRPEDLELKSPVPGERRFVRYARGFLVDAWLVSPTPIDPSPVTGFDKPVWSGVLLGPGEDGWLAYGLARSWNVGERTVLHWKDRVGKREVLVSRAAPTMQYGVGRAEPMTSPGDTGARPKLSGDFRKEARPYVGSLASCFDTSPKPVEATIALKLDSRGQPSRIRVSADQPAFNLEQCVASALMELKGEPNAEGTLSMLRFQ
jgi:hypothetical protein